MRDPYKVLGVSPTASDEEIKEAYRALVKKYHPDRYANSPMQEQAQEKLKEINLAYDTITKQREGGDGQGFGGFGGFGGGSTPPRWDSQGGTEQFADIREMISRGLIAQAEAALERMHNRTAEWYYLRGMVYMRRGWYAQARQCFDTAAQMEPDNPEYQVAAQRMQGAYQSGWQRRSGTGGRGLSDNHCCTACLMMSCLNTCCGGGGGFFPLLCCRC